MQETLYRVDCYIYDQVIYSEYTYSYEEAIEIAKSWKHSESNDHGDMWAVIEHLTSEED